MRRAGFQRLPQVSHTGLSSLVASTRLQEPEHESDCCQPIVEVAVGHAKVEKCLGGDLVNRVRRRKRILEQVLYRRVAWQVLLESSVLLPQEFLQVHASPLN